MTKRVRWLVVLSAVFGLIAVSCGDAEVATTLADDGDAVADAEAARKALEALEAEDARLAEIAQAEAEEAHEAALAKALQTAEIDETAPAEDTNQATPQTTPAEDTNQATPETQSGPPAFKVSITVRLDDGQSATSAVSASWEVEDGADVARYDVAIGSVMGGSDVLDWHDVGLATTYHPRDGQDGVSLALHPNRDYYLDVRAVGPDGTVLGAASSGAWYLYEPYTFDVARYPSVMLNAPGSFSSDAQPDWYPWDTINWDEAYEAYLVGSAAIDLYHKLGERVLIGSPKVTILQTENGFPIRDSIVRLGPSSPDGDEHHANSTASMLYDCDEYQDLPFSMAYNYYEGCQTNTRKYAMTSGEMRRRLQEVVLVPETAGSFESRIFGEMGAPQIWAMPHTFPTNLCCSEDYEDDLVRGLRLGDWIFARYNILAVSPQPGSAGQENYSLSGNYYNSLVVSGPIPYPTHYGQSSIDNTGGSRHKPDLAVSASNLNPAPSWSTGTMAAAVSALLGLSYTEPLLSGSAHAEAMRAIILAGAGKDHLWRLVESEQYFDSLPSASEKWQWTNTETAPLDPLYGAGLFNYRNSFDILTAGRSTGGDNTREVGWDTRFLAEGQSATYTFTATEAHDSFSLALTWFRHVAPNRDGSFSADLPDFRVELLDQDGTTLARSDDPHNNIEHIYLPQGLQTGRRYSIEVTLKSAENPTRYGLAWQTRVDATQHSPWRS